MRATSTQVAAANIMAAAFEDIFLMASWHPVSLPPGPFKLQPTEMGLEGVCRTDFITTLRPNMAHATMACVPSMTPDVMFPRGGLVDARHASELYELQFSSASAELYHVSSMPAASIVRAAVPLPNPSHLVAWRGCSGLA